MDYFFVGDGSEVLFCDAHEVNARAEMERLQKENPLENYTVYSLDPNEKTTDSEGVSVLAYPAEHAAKNLVY